MSTIKNRLKALRYEKGLTQDELVSELNSKIDDSEKAISKMTISNWENNKHSIKQDKSELLADYFGVSEAYLLGYSIYRNPIEQILSIQGKDLGNGLKSISQEDLNQLPFKDIFMILLDFHDLALSNDDIDKVIDLIKSLSGINKKILNNLVTDGGIEKLEKLKDGDFSKLFTYSSNWSKKYNNLKNTDN
ncbi:helix-turn-helix domain-containing protein [Streptococcus parasanguinis]|mgnify:CR=1 FL=1|uniref:helix-turn-helix domain-containing protein n=1 Tax=Streptococcus parasanguinis TaxID=1318 RepID=UPI002001761B|nr:helix-turn-helix transcriptional regulator [Streptococcus parasanguinis]